MLLIGNGRMITRDSSNPFLEDGCVAIENGKIIEIGVTALLRGKHSAAEFIDAEGGVIMPGMVNVHNHIYSALARGLSINGYAPKGFLDVLDGLWWTIDRNLMLDATEASADATFIDCIENGVTTVIDHHASYGAIEGSLFRIAKSAEKYGVRANLCYEISDRDGKEKMKAAVKENVDFLTWCKEQDSDWISGMMGMHAQFTMSDDTLAYCMEQKPEGVGCHIHVAEGIYDVTQCVKEHGKRPVFRLHDFGVLGHNSICGHCTHVSEAEMELLKDTDTMVSHNPESNMGNAIGCPPVLRMFHKGILIGLGTDGYTNDMIESYKVANLLHKHELCDPTVAWGEIPDMLFENNPKMCARFMKTPLGVLTPGAQGDVIVMDYDPLTPMTKDNINGHIMFGMNGHNVKTTVIGGKVKMKNRRLIDIDKEQVMAHSREQAKDLCHRING
ncbi:MAG: putative aminohydrolase SsnA [Eubacteriales bacterium]|nr:putative aminohydrolase SsnA [Eubacteriales bacterium]